MQRPLPKVLKCSVSGPHLKRTLSQINASIFILVQVFGIPDLRISSHQKSAHWKNQVVNILSTSVIFPPLPLIHTVCVQLDPLISRSSAGPGSRLILCCWWMAPGALGALILRKCGSSWRAWSPPSTSAHMECKLVSQSRSLHGPSVFVMAILISWVTA